MSGKRSKRVRRLDEVRPAEVGRTVCRSMQRLAQHAEAWLTVEDTNDVDDDDVPKTRISAALVKLTAYAQGDSKAAPATMAKLARTILVDALSNMIVTYELDDPMFEKIDPYLSELTMICCAVLGRYRVEVEKMPIPDSWLAALISVKPATIRTYLCLDDKPSVHLSRPKNERGLVTYQSAVRLLERRDDYA